MGYLVTVRVINPEGGIHCFAVVWQRETATTGSLVGTFDTAAAAKEHAMKTALRLDREAISTPARPQKGVVVASGATLELGFEVELLPEAWRVPDPILFADKPPKG